MRYTSGSIFRLTILWLVFGIAIGAMGQQRVKQQGAKSLPGQIAGRVTIQGKPAPGISVRLFRQAESPTEEADTEPIATTETDAQGRYRFSDIPPGRYWLAPVAPEYFNTKNGPEGLGLTATVTAEKGVAGANLDMTLGGVISGRITDADGNPVAGESVDLVYSDAHKARAGDGPQLEDDDVKTDSGGVYRIIGIPPGSYWISIGEDIAGLTGGPSPHDMIGNYPSGSRRVEGDHYFEQTFYPGVTDPAHAKAIEVSAGKEVRDLSFAVGKRFKTYTAAGRVVDAKTGQPIPDCRLMLGHRVAEGGYSSTSVGDDNEGPDTDGNGEFRITGLLRGRFFISPRFDGESDLYASPVELEIKDGDVAGLEIKAHRGVTLSGSVTIDGSGEAEAGAKLTGLKVGVAFKEGDDYGTKEGTVNSDGSFKIRGVTPGQVRVHLPFDAKTSRYFSLLRVEYSRGYGDDAQKEIATVEDPVAEARAKLMASWMRGQSPSADPPVLQPGAPAPGAIAIAPGAVAVAGSPSTGTAVAPRAAIAAPLIPGMPMIVPTLIPGGPSGGAAFASVALGDRDLEGVNVVVDYNNAAIKGHVDVETGTFEGHLMAMISRSEDQGRSDRVWPVDPNGNFALDGLKSGHYQISIFDVAKLPDMKHVLAEKTLELKKNTQVQVSLTIKQKEK
jgi:protocatechuate 3,4-dioxygenase beta subunit